MRLPRPGACSLAIATSTRCAVCCARALDHSAPRSLLPLQLIRHYPVLADQTPNETYADKVLSNDPLVRRHVKQTGTCASHGKAHLVASDPVFKDAQLYF